MGPCLTAAPPSLNANKNHDKADQCTKATVFTNLQQIDTAARVQVPQATTVLAEKSLYHGHGAIHLACT